MDLILLIVFIYAIKSAAEDARKAYRKSKTAYMSRADERFPGMPRSRRAVHAARHDTGYWAAQALRGLPASRHGLAAGWHAGRQAQAEGKAAREKARAEHLEARASAVPQIGEFRARQKAALEQLRTARRTVPGNDIEGRCLYCGAPDGKECDPACPYLNMNWREVERMKLERAAGTGEGAPAAPQGSRRVDGKPETDADRRFFDLRESGYKGPIDQDGNIPVGPVGDSHACGDPNCACDCHADSAEPDLTGPAAHQPAGTENTTKGTPTMPVAADTTYDGVLMSMTAAKADAEVKAAEAQQASKNADSLADQMQGVEVDTGTLSAMLDHQAAHDAVIKAHQTLYETAEAVEMALKRGHAGLSEAHKDAPVQAAAREFYSE